MPFAPNTEIKGYVIVEELNRGAFANAYLARKGGVDIFLKEFKSPKPVVDWYVNYLAYQDEIWRRIESTSLKNYVSAKIEFFQAEDPPRFREVTRKFYQAHEFVTGGKDLAKIITEIRGGGTHDWKRRLVFAKVLMASIAELHNQKIVHGDLKPENIFLIPDAGIGAGFRLKLIDLDFSILTDRPAPWHGKQGYVQTPGWGSPEHLRGEVPKLESDVFTCGLILYDLLAVGSPYQGLSPAEYFECVMGHTAPKPRLAGEHPEATAVVGMLHQCLSPSPNKRPTAAEVQRALIGKRSAPVATAGKLPRPVRTPPPPEPRPSAVPTIDGIVLMTEGGDEISFLATTKLNQPLLKSHGITLEVWDRNCQVTIERRADGWYAVPAPGTPNDTLLDGLLLGAATRLCNGQVLAVGRASKGVIRTPLTVKLR